MLYCGSTHVLCAEGLIDVRERKSEADLWLSIAINDMARPASRERFEDHFWNIFLLRLRLKCFVPSE